MGKTRRNRVVAALGAGGVLATVLDATTGTRSLFATYQGAENYSLLLRPAPVKLPGGGAGQPSNQ